MEHMEAEDMKSLGRQIRTVVAMSGFEGMVRILIGDERKAPDEICSLIEIDGLNARHKAVMEGIRKTLSGYDLREIDLKTELGSVKGERDANIEAIKDLYRKREWMDRRIQELEQLLCEKSLLLDDRNRSLEQANAESQKRYEALKSIMDAINCLDAKSLTARKCRNLLARIKMIAANSPA